MTSYIQQHGAFVNKDNTTHFSLWAPDARSIGIQLGNEELVRNLHREPDGWYSVTLECTAGTPYRFIINNELEIPDPASRQQLNDVHGWSSVINHAYPWKQVTWHGRPWHEAIIYELHVGTLGGFSKVEEMLPTLVALGITAIELMPINEFPGERNWGYDGVLLFAPESSYGTPDELKSLIDTAHSLDLMVFLDVVYNHFGPDGNYLGQYAKGFFRTDTHTQWGVAIDYRSQPVRDFFCENALMWILDYRFDGLRIDAAHAINDKDFLIELAHKIRSAIPSTRHVHLILENEDNAASLLSQGFDAQWNDDGHNILHHLLTNEHEGYYQDFVEQPTEKLSRCLSEGFVYQGEYTARGFVRGEPSAHLPPTAFVLFLQNHDQIGNRALGERLTQLADPDALKASVALLLLSPMIPLLFMGEEWGSRQPFLYFTDHNAELAQAVCEGRRKEFEHFSAFSDAQAREKIPNPNDVKTFTQSCLEPSTHNTAEHQEWWEFYQHLLYLRKTEITPHLEKVESMGVIILAERALMASWRLGNNSVLRIYINLSIMPVPVTPSWVNARLIFSHQVLSAEYQQGILTAGSVLVCMDTDNNTLDKNMTEEFIQSNLEATISEAIAEPVFVLVD